MTVYLNAQFDPAAKTYEVPGVDPSGPVRVQRFSQEQWVVFDGASRCVGAGTTRDNALTYARGNLGTTAPAPPTARDILMAQQRALLADQANPFAATGAGPAPREVLALQLTPDLRRVFNLPEHHHPPAALCVQAMEHVFCEPGSAASLRPYQALALFHAAHLYAHHPGTGMLVSAGVGQGKTLLSVLLPTVFHARTPLLLLPASMVSSFALEVTAYRQRGFRNFNAPTVITHEALGAPGASTLLADLNPDLIIIDEAGAFASDTSVRVRRLRAFKESHDHVPLVPMSATFLKAALRNVSHLCQMTLGVHSPLPTHFPDLQALGSAVDADPHKKRHAPGVLLELLPPSVARARDVPDVTKARMAVRRLLTNKLGYLLVPEELRAAGETAAPLSYNIMRPTPPTAVTRALADLEDTWTTPAGIVFDDALTMYRSAMEVAAGFHTSWTPPFPTDWVTARREVSRVISRLCKRPRRGMPDSPGSWVKSLRTGVTDAGHTLPATIMVQVDEVTGHRVDLRAAWRTWADCAAQHETSDALGAPYPGAVRTFTPLDPYLHDVVRTWVAGGPGIIWTRSPDFAEWVATACGLPYFGAGESGDGIVQAPATESVVASVQVHHKGKNLQRWHRNLLLQPFGSADVMEQCIGRTHRAGQTCPVTVDVCCPTLHGERALASALRRSRFVAEVEGTEYRLWRYGMDLTFRQGTDADERDLRALEEDGL